MASSELVKFQHVSKSFKTSKKKEHEVLKDVNLVIRKGKIFGIIGYSGAGKSTLIRCINGIEDTTQGKVFFEDKEINQLSKKSLRQVRGQIGMIFQQFNLMPARTIAENVALPIRYSKLGKQKIKEKVKKMLELVGLPEKANAYPSSLSGGQKQRVAIARALINDPKILLCDEATSALDPQTTQSILELLKKLNKSLGITLVIVTHEMQVVEDICDEIAVLNKGKIVEQGDVYSIFVNPQAELTKRFINTTSKLNISDSLLNTINLTEEQRLVKITYISDEAVVPLISIISLKFKIKANIIVGDIKILRGKPLGGLIIVLDGESAQVTDTLKYLKEQKNIQVEVYQNGRFL
ncbi:methionine ABC transporter [Liquorilactobacillus sucicola DSM 21376 = JCM 15457]|uniref:ABC superfamily ATP binding cassette transporter, binding protein n=1 Tax=Liquorilactobacillus sucicola DSM 21376 = JCM 15457 TaxID=1423806 RepID=A0A023CYJ0_9LACO|nr:methionine ABC transporter ATP-binding protein [Liquorilactobacillus sucicola]KRN07498.1 ABC superfamily ATP binding cassette transporter, binding protein [Liquorilactobacillus sucicola DSM 21376 = JCM 15457]GAJ26874.1 methionine ABC transporter [Liquorilactobacillus sucicola DSM 21376 = JCM 15457]